MQRLFAAMHWSLLSSTPSSSNFYESGAAMLGAAPRGVSPLKVAFQISGARKERRVEQNLQLN